MAFQGFFKNYLDILMAPFFQHFFVSSFPVGPVIFYLNLNKIQLLLAGKSIILLYSTATNFLMI